MQGSCKRFYKLNALPKTCTRRPRPTTFENFEFRVDCSSQPFGIGGVLGRIVSNHWLFSNRMTSYVRFLVLDTRHLSHVCFVVCAWPDKTMQKKMIAVLPWDFQGVFAFVCVCVCCAQEDFVVDILGKRNSIHVVLCEGLLEFQLF